MQHSFSPQRGAIDFRILSLFPAAERLTQPFFSGTSYGVSLSAAHLTLFLCKLAVDQVQVLRIKYFDLLPRPRDPETVMLSLPFCQMSIVRKKVFATCRIWKDSFTRDFP